MKRLDAAPFHTFARDGHHFVHDLATRETLVVRPAMFDFLSQRDLILSGKARVALRGVAERHGVETARLVAREFNALCDRGLFRRWIMGPDKNDDDRTVERLVHAGSNKIELYLAEACNLRCRYCYAGSQGALQRQRLMPRRVAAAALDLLFQRAGDAAEVHVTFLGGEPLLNKSVFHWTVNTAHERAEHLGKRVRFSLTTNATLLDDAVIRQIKRHNFGLMISMDGPPEIHNANRPLRSGRGSFDLASRGVRRLMRRRRQVTARCTLAHCSADKLRAVEYLEEFGFTRVAMSPAMGTAEAKGAHDLTDQDWERLDAQEADLFTRWLERAPTGEHTPYNPFVRSIQRLLRPETPRVRCGIGRGCTTVGTDGRLYPCHRYVGMDAHVIGDVWNGADPERLRRCLWGYISALRKCESCWAVRLCGGPCPRYVARADGTHQEANEAHCVRIRRGFEMAAAWAAVLRERAPAYYEDTVLGSLQAPVSA